MKKVFSIIIVIFWMALIFFFSHQPGEQSGELSDGITAMLIGMLHVVIPGAEDIITGLFIRKLAHFSVYFMLAILLMNAFRCFQVTVKKSIIPAFIISVLYAISDEVHQAFIPGRGPQVTDVLLDSAGALVGIGVYCALLHIFTRKRYSGNNVR
ncbi:VanZ family protein [Ornithinibacillus halotolerans]|uniref:VanZ-like domain-containing protein n=1 Tax=Ornithinibacillus halotolerans TaxID=1274357 RepID=A0A916S097_9BACI|nr:VanZ family protein [Ornithinibacillus halotolerans]GGA78961.1 hypothetical protein GCM10008025_23010 [Ornithinibacillus halotolerans]